MTLREVVACGVGRSAITEITRDGLLLEVRVLPRSAPSGAEVEHEPVRFLAILDGRPAAQRNVDGQDVYWVIRDTIEAAVRGAVIAWDCGLAMLMPPAASAGPHHGRGEPEGRHAV